jgi:hypothetical protein
MIFMNLVRRFRGELLPFEKTVLDAVIACSPTDLQKPLERQVRAVNKVQRHAQGREINFYRTCRGKPTFDDEIRLRSLRLEAVLARVTVRLLRTDDRIVVSVWLVRGFIFSLALSRPVLANDNFEENLSVDSCEILPGVLEPANASPWPIEYLPEELLQWRLDGEVTCWRDAMSANDREIRLAAVDSILPTDYVDLLVICDGFSSGRIRVNGLAELGPTPTDCGNVIILATVASTLGIGVMEGSREISTYIVDYTSDERPRPVGHDLRYCLSEALKQC